jgi:hypothetical protein
MELGHAEHGNCAWCLQAIGQWIQIRGSMLHTSLRSWRTPLPTSKCGLWSVHPKTLVPLGQGLDGQEANPFQIVISTSQAELGRRRTPPHGLQNHSDTTVIYTDPAPNPTCCAQLTASGALRRSCPRLPVLEPLDSLESNPVENLKKTKKKKSRQNGSS